jgi:hypothetical protein
MRRVTAKFRGAGIVTVTIGTTVRAAEIRSFGTTNSMKGNVTDVRRQAMTDRPIDRAPLRSPQWWLAEIKVHGNPTLVDGPHDDEAGAHQAAYLIAALGMQRGRRFAVARVELTEPVPDATGANHEAIDTMRPLIERRLP